MKALDVLRRDHRFVLRGLDAAEEAIARMRDGEDPPRAVLDDLLDFLRNFAGRYHRVREEKVLLPWLEARVGEKLPELGGWLGREARTAEAYLAAAVRARARFPEGKRAFVEHLTAYVWLARWQIGMEENLLFGVAEHFPDADEALLAGFDEAVPDAELVEARFVTVLRRLERDLGLGEDGFGMPWRKAAA